MEFFNYWLLVLKIFLKFCFIQAHKNKSTGSWTEFWHTLKWRSSFNIKVLVCVPRRFKRNAASLFNSNTKMFISRTTFLRNVDVSNWKVTLTEILLRIIVFTLQSLQILYKYDTPYSNYLSMLDTAVSAGTYQRSSYISCMVSCIS